MLLEGFEYLNQNDLVENFAARVWAYSAEYGITFERGSYRTGESSMGLEYKPSSGSGYLKVQKQFSAPLNWSDFNGISAYIYGDSSGNEISVKIKDGYGNIWRSPWLKADWNGWKRAEFRFAEFKQDLFDADGEAGNRPMMLGEVSAFAIAEKGARNSKLLFDDIKLVSDKYVSRIKLAGENEPPAGCILRGIEAPRADAIRYAVPKDWSEASGISFRAKGDKSGSEFAVMAADSDNEYYRTPWIKDVWAGWKEFYYDFDMFVREPREAVAGGDGVFGQKKIKSLLVVVRGKEASAVHLEDLALSCHKEAGHSPVEGLKGFSSGGRIFLYWDPSDDPFLLNYKIYRDGSRIAATGSEFYSEAAPAAERSHEYGVAAVYSDGYESAPAQVSVMAQPSGRISRREEVAVNGNWIYVGGKKFFVKGIEYRPYGPGMDPRFDTPSLKSVEDDMARIRQAGFNTVAAAYPFSERDIIIAEKNGLMVIQRLDITRIRQITGWSRRHGNILYYTIPAGIEPEAALSYAREAKSMDPDREVSVAYSELCDHPKLPVFGIAGVVPPAYGPGGLMPYDYAKWYKDAYAKDRPLVVSGISGAQAVEFLGGMIAAGATGVCVTDRTAALSRVFLDFWPYYSKASRNEAYDPSLALQIKTDKQAYKAGQKPKISFTLAPASNAAVYYSINDTKNGISNRFAAKMNAWGAYKSSFTLPYNTDDNIFSVFAVAVTSEGKRAVGMKNMNVSEDRSLKEKFKAEVSVYERPPYEIKHAARRISVDGLAGDEWSGAPEIYLDGSQAGKPVLKSGECAGDRDLSGRVKLLWDEDNIYVLAEIKDDMPMVNSRSRHNIRNGDALELFLSSDPDNLPKEGYSSRDFQAVLGANSMMWIYGQAGGGTRNAAPKDSDIAVRHAEAGYTIEARISTGNFGYDDFTAGRELALDVALDDADGTGARECQLIWNGAEDNDRNSRYWGRAVLRPGQ
ncbi:MAG: CIA30 family protein [Candidatus Omnitrophica bacterium]|nr:CIA30 family protein [Candidatus Omnitrophota bacterium]